MLESIINLTIMAAIFLAAIISAKFNTTVAIIEILFGILLSNPFSITATDWMQYLASLGGIVLTFLAGAEVDLPLLRAKFKESFLIGFLSFMLPFISVILFCYYALGWGLSGALIGGCALSTTSLAVVYSVLVETGLTNTEIGKLLMCATFITDIGTAVALSVLFLEFSLFTVIFFAISIIVIVVGTKSKKIFNHPALENRVTQPQIKYLLLLIFILMFFAELGDSHAILPVFVLGVFIAPLLNSKGKTGTDLQKTFRSIAYVMITPFFFIVGGLRVSLPLLFGAFWLFLILFGIKMLTKFVATYHLTKRYCNGHHVFFTLLMSTGLTFGTISSLYGLEMGYIDQVQFSVLIAVVIFSAIIPTVIAQKFFFPKDQCATTEIVKETGKTKSNDPIPS